MPRPHPIQRAAQYARNAGQGVSHAQSKAPHVWSFSCPKNREGSDYDKLSPAGMNPDDAQLSDVHFPCTDPVGSHTGPHATSTGTIDQSPQERAKKKTGLIGSKTEFIQERPLSTSMPGSPFLIQKKSLKHRSNSGTYIHKSFICYRKS